jgi:hypothetical protein
MSDSLHSGPAYVTVTLLGRKIERSLLPPETAEEVIEAVARIEEIIESLEGKQRASALADATNRIATPSASMRKLEKRLRQTAIATTGRRRLERIRELAPDLDIVDIGGTVRFRTYDEMDVMINGHKRRVPLVATVVGGPLERAFLTDTEEEFVQQAMSRLDTERRNAERNNRRLASQIERIVEEREAQPLYDHKRLHSIVDRAIRSEPELELAVEQIRYELRPLDRTATERERVRSLVEERGLIAYRDYFPRARALNRELVLFAGPTNSGKTWRALNELVLGETGAYLAPLRLLALEGQTEIEKRGHNASYLTGEERDIREDARFIASTIEMLNTNIEYDTVVIDEVQLLTDDSRGWAWCQALVGAPGKRIIMTGSPDCIPLVQQIADYLGEPLTIHHLERYTPVAALPKPMQLRDIEPGTAVIAFTRRDVLGLKAELETRFKVAVIYGNLTPEVRREEARRFRSGEAQVLVATDSIALGLNLPIETVLFSTLQKWDGKDDVQLEPWQILQIGGRAGRYGHAEAGYVGAMHPADARRVSHVFDPDFVPPPRGLQTWVRPSSDHIEVIAAGLRTTSLAHALTTFQRGMTFDSTMLQPGVDDEMIALAQILDDHRSLSLAERLNLSAAPVDGRSEWMQEEFAHWMALHASGRSVTLHSLPHAFTKQRAFNDEELRAAEMEAKRLTLYSWLSYRYPASFPDLEECSEQRVALDQFIERSLAVKSREGPRPGHGGPRGAPQAGARGGPRGPGPRGRGGRGRGRGRH